MFVLLSILTVCLFSASDVSAALTDSQSSYQTAFLYFLPDYEPKSQDEAEVRGCAKLGYTVTRANCAAPRILKDKCPTGNFYKTCYCAGSPTCTGSASSSNPYPSSTGASSSSCMNCAGSTLYSWSCSSSTCASYSLSSCPSNGNCSRCCNGKYKLDSCASGYSVSGNSCSCATTCTDKVSSKPANSSYTTSSCTACGVTTTIKTGWACNSGYTKSGSSCVEECTPLSNETGCSYGTYSCSDGCGGTRSCCSAAPAHTHSYSCPSGYSETNSWGSSALTASKTCSCGKTSGICYRCFSGGSATCIGQTEGCTSSQLQVSSCKDCSGTTLYTCRNIVRGDIYYKILDNSYKCFFNEQLRKYQGVWGCHAYCEVNGEKRECVNCSSDYQLRNCAGTYTNADTEDECLSKPADPIIGFPGYYPQGGTNKCIAYED